MKRPLAGTRVMLTRPAREAEPLARRLRALGALVATVPLIEIGPPHDAAALQAAVDAADLTDWIVFTSANGVDAFARRRHAPLSPRVRIAAVGPATARAVAKSIRRAPDLVPARFVAEELADAIVRRADAGASVAIFAAQGARDVLASRLRAAGLAVASTGAYATRETPPPDLAERISAADIVVLASGSAARALIVGLASGPGVRALDGKQLVCIGPVTAEQARERGLSVASVAASATPDGLVAAIKRVAGG